MQSVKKLSDFIYTVLPIPLFQDNYCYLVHKTPTPSHSFLVDPADPPTIMEFLKQNPQYQIQAVLYTHKHWDHAGNSDQLKIDLPNTTFFSSKTDGEHIKLLSDNETFELQEIGTVNCIAVPCHTKGHMLYQIGQGGGIEKIEENNQVKFQVNSMLFSGDTLFVGGCGRFFEGNAEQMLINFDRISSLPDDTQIFCGHEYTKANYEWAIGVDYNNSQLKDRYNWALNTPMTIPTSVGQEKQTNVFMRCRDPDLCNILSIQDPIEVMNKLRDLKNSNQKLV